MTKLYFFIFILVLFFVFTENKFFDLKESKLTTVEKVTICKENKLKLHVGIHKFNRTHVAVDMNITLFEMFDHTYESDLEVRLGGDGGWKKNSIHIYRKNSCKILYFLLGPTWEKIIDEAHAPRRCSVPPGYYHFENFYVDLSKCPIVVQPGRFQVISKIIKNNILQTCVIVEVLIK